jgi:hypothetical protein
MYNIICLDISSMNNLTYTFNMPSIFLSHYQDYDTFDISNLFYNVTSLDEKNIVDLFGDASFDLHLEANMEKDTFGIKVKSTETNESIARTCVSISFYYSISDTIHKENVKKMFDNWSKEIFQTYESLIKQYNKEYDNEIQNEINIMKCSC